MDEGANRMKPEPDPDQLSERAAESRARLDALVSEIDHRRHLVTRARTAVRERPAWFVGGGVALLALAGGVVLLVVKRHRSRQRLSARGRRLREAVARMIDKPDRVAAQDPSMRGKLLTAAATTLVTTLIKRAVTRSPKPV
jgi:hypothetical protein